MSVIRLSPSMALAMEIAHALIFNKIREWYDHRISNCHYGFSERFGESKERDTHRFFLRRLSAFAKSLNSFRITKVVSPGIKGLDDQEDQDDVFVSIVEIHLGNEQGASQVIVEVSLTHPGSSCTQFEREEGTFDDRWEGWSIPDWTTLKCTKHPDRKFQDYIVLGKDALPENID